MASTSLLAKEHFLLGTFSTNCSGGMTVSKLPDRWTADWESNLRIGKLLDDAGIDFMLPIARWIGYGGETNFHGYVLETITWATALLANTKNLTVFATVHTTANHPVVIAKQIATMAQIGKERVGLNIVAGWNKPEYEALGLQLPDDHETRYGYAQEWFDVIKKLWSHDGTFDWEGEYFKLKAVHSDPKPQVNVPILNAAGSSEGREFAVRNANFLFTPAIDLERSKVETAKLREQAKAAGRDVGILTIALVSCAPTEKEAQDHYNYFYENSDWEAVDNLVNLQFAHAQSFPHDLLKLIRDRMASGHGAYPLIGTPEQVAQGFVDLAEAGFSGTTIAFLDWNKEFPYFRDNVLPILEEKGLRKPFARQ